MLVHDASLQRVSSCRKVKEMDFGDVERFRYSGNNAGQMEVFVADYMYMGMLFYANVCGDVCFRFHEGTLP